MRDGTRKRPSELLALKASTFVSVCVTVICALGMIAPLGSVTLPEIMPVFCCANRGIASRKARAIRPIPSRLRKLFSFAGIAVEVSNAAPSHSHAHGRSPSRVGHPTGLFRPAGERKFRLKTAGHGGRPTAVYEAEWSEWWRDATAPQ